MIIISSKEQKILLKELEKTNTYQEWKEVASKLDTLLNNDLWKAYSQCQYYDDQLIKRLSQNLEYYRKKNDPKKIKELLLSGGLKNNIGNVLDVRLYNKTFIGSKNVF